MTNGEIRLLARVIDRVSLELCYHYTSCEKCPMHTKWSIIKLSNGSEFGANCTSLIMKRVFAENMPKEDETDDKL